MYKEQEGKFSFRDGEQRDEAKPEGKKERVWSSFEHEKKEKQLLWKSWA